MKPIVINIFLLVVACCLTSGVASSVVKVVVIDAGHGGKDPGTRGTKVLEKTITLSIALKVGYYIEKYIKGVRVIYTRNKDTFVSLDERADIANKNKADVFISIHANALSNINTKGTETYIMGIDMTEENLEISHRENAVILLDGNYKERYEGFDPNSPESYILFSLTQNAHQEGSMRIASLIEDQFRIRVKRKSRGVKQAGFWVLWRTSMPSVLVEVGFLTNASEEKYLSSTYGQDIIASGIYRAFKMYKNQTDAIN